MNLTQLPKKHKSGLFLKLLVSYLIVSSLVLVFFVGYFFGLRQSGSFPGGEIYQKIVQLAPQNLTNQEVDFELFWEVWRYVAANYVKQPINEQTAFYGSLQGLVASLGDPYSIFLDPSETEDFDVEISGQFEGIGAEIGIKEDKLLVIAPLSNSPAEKAGLRAGDYIIKIDEHETYGLSVDEAVQFIRGERGTVVNLLIQHESESEPINISITRETISEESVDWRMLDNNIGYVEIISFTTETPAQFSQAVTELLLKEPVGLILDLRNNPGGYLDEAVQVAGEFLDNKLVVSEEFSGGERQEHYSDGQHRLLDFPTTVLIGPGTASAAEIVAGALQDYSAGTLVGQTTFGKGSVQDYTRFDDGSSLKLTVAHWLTPDGRSIDQTGIEPDILVEFTEADLQAGCDPQLEKALELLLTKP